MEIPQKIKNKLLIYNPAIPLLGIYLKGAKTLIEIGICTPISLQPYLQPSYGNYTIKANKLRKRSQMSGYKGQGVGTGGIE